MQHKTILKWSAAVVVGLLAIGACNDDTTVGPNAKAPPTTPSLLFAGGNNFNGTGACLAHDAAFSGYTNGVNGDTTVLAGTTHCTANDIRVAHADLIEYSTNGTTFTQYTGQSVTCNEGDSLWVHLHTDIHQTDNSQRTDIGLWIAMDGGNARTGTCNHYNLIPPSFSNIDSLGVWNIDGDHCGDMNAADSTSVDIGTIKVLCETATSTSTSLHVGSCIGWTQPGGNQACPQGFPQSGEDAIHYRYGTVPGTTSKCNCEGFDIGITVNRSAYLEVKKACDPTTDTGTFDLLIDGSSQFANNVSCGGTTGKQKLGAGTNVSPGAVHTFGEGDFTVANYTSSYSCVNRGTATVRASGTSLGPNNITLQPNDDVVCTYTNVRKPQVKLVKAFDPTTDPGKVDFAIGASPFDNGGTGYGNGGNTGFQIVSVGAVAISESAHSGTDLGNYVSTLACKNAANGDVTVGSNAGTSGSITVAAGDQITCTFTNTRKPRLTVNKVCDPTTDGGKFNLQVDGATAGTGANAACGGTTGTLTSTIGAHTVGETAGTGTSLSDYNAVIGGDCAANGSITLAAGDNKTCTITNTRKGTLTVNKVCSPTTDAGKFNLQIDGATAGTGANAACGGTTGAVFVSLTSHTVGETAGTGTNLGNYDMVIGGDCAANGAVTVNAGDNKVCTITNTRKPKLTVNKVCDPTTDAGKFNLQIDGSTAGTGANAACGGTTGAVTSTIGAHTVGETAGTGTTLADYGTVIGGDCASNGSITLAAGDNKTCTITNTHKPTLTVNKVCNPTTDGGKFNLQIDGATAGTGANAACGGTTGAIEVTIGAHTAGELAGTGTSLGDYTTAIGGDCAANGSVTINAGDHKTCTITNTKKPKLTVNKVCDPTTDPGLFNLQIDGSTAGTGANAACGGTTGAVFQTIGAHTVGETGGTGTSLGDYSTVIGGDCGSNGSVSLAAGDSKTCTITNRTKSTIIIEKEVVGGGTQSFTFTRTLAGGGADLGDNPAPTLTNGQSSSSGKKLVAGSYKVCETNLPVAWQNPTAAGYTLVGDGLGNFCATFSLGWGETKTIHFVNTPPPGGATRTIGYWKNWSSCSQSNGKQYEKAIAAGHPEQTLDGNLASVFPIGDITTLTTCQAVNLLSKNAINGDKRPGDPIYNMVAQLLGAKLNVAAGAGTCGALTTALDQAQTLLTQLSFDGTGSYKGSLTSAQQSLANSLNSTLTSYNEGTLGGGCPTGE